MENLKHGYIVVDGISFPTTEVDGMTMVEYPMFNPELAPKITEEGRKHIKELQEFTRNLIKERNIEFIYQLKQTQK
jgi:hypothetical protein